MNNFPFAFTVCGILCLVAAVIALAIRPGDLRSVREPFSVPRIADGSSE